MNRLLAIGALCAALIILPSCSQGSLDKLTASLDRFDAGVERIDASIAKVSPKLAQKCGAAQSVGSDLATLAPGSSTAASGLQGVNAGIRTFCQAPPTDIASAISAIINVAAAGVEAYKQAKSGRT